MLKEESYNSDVMNFPMNFELSLKMKLILT